MEGGGAAALQRPARGVEGRGSVDQAYGVSDRLSEELKVGGREG